MTGLTRQKAAEAVASLFGTMARQTHESRTYDPWEVIDNEGKKWRFVYDSSIHASHRSGRQQLPISDGTYKVEMNSPKLEYSEMGKLQEVVRALRHAGAVVNGSCGMHVHVDASKHTPQSLKNALSIMYSKEDILFKALNVNEHRVERWCQKVREPMLEKIRKLPTNTTMERLKREWYGGRDESYEHYNWTRYYALNLHSVFYRSTLEWRCFESTLHAGKVRANITLALAISALAINQSRTVMRKTEISENPAFTFRTFIYGWASSGRNTKMCGNICSRTSPATGHGGMTKPNTPACKTAETKNDNTGGDENRKFQKANWYTAVFCLWKQYEPKPDGLPLPRCGSGGYRPAGRVPPCLLHERRREWRRHYPAGRRKLCGRCPLADLRTG